MKGLGNTPFFGLLLLTYLEGGDIITLQLRGDIIILH